MARFSDVDVFLAVAIAGSFRGAVVTLGISRSTVSRAIRRLETHLGESLFLRDKRSVRLTDAGVEYYKYARQAAIALAEGERSVGALSGALQGLIRISAPKALGPEILGPICSGFLAKYPRVTIALDLTNRLVNPLRDEIDVAIRLGQRLDDSELVSQKLASVPIIAVVNPQLADLIHVTDDVPWIAFTPRGTRILTPPGSPKRLQMRLSVNSLSTAISIAEQGAGLLVTSEILVLSRIHRGTLVRVLKDWSLPAVQIRALYPEARLQPLKVRVFVEYVRLMLANWRDHTMG